MRCRCAVELATPVDARAVSIEHVRSLGLSGLVINGSCTPETENAECNRSSEYAMVEENTCICQQSPMLAEKNDTMHKNKTFNQKNTSKNNDRTT